jgi:polysaccharide biosynthesis protein PelE
MRDSRKHEKQARSLASCTASPRALTDAGGARRRARRLSTLVLIGAPACAQAALVLCAIQLPDRVLELAAAHVAICGLFGAAFLLMSRNGTPSTFVVLYLVSVAALGPAGVIGCAWLKLVSRIPVRSAESPGAWYESMLPQVRFDPARRLVERIAWRGPTSTGDSTVASFADVLELGTVEQKRAVVTRVADHFRPEFAETLRRALNDPEPAIRVQAATAAARVENGFLERSVQLEAARTARPEDSDLLRQIASHHESYARSGLLDADRAANERRSALALHRMLLETSGPDPDLIAAAARLHLELEEPAAAMGVLTPLLDLHPLPDAAVAPLAQALYLTGRFGSLRDLGEQLLARLGLGEDESVRDALRLWCRHHA